MSDAPITPVSATKAAVIAAVLSSAATATVMSPPNILKQMTGAYQATPPTVVPWNPIRPEVKQELTTQRNYTGEYGMLPDAGHLP